jgi:anti-sigma28 factor (negative regulator of flagellin synthesis)
MKDRKLGKNGNPDGSAKDGTPLLESAERTARVAELRRKYLSGEYRVDAETVAAAIVNEDLNRHKR